ncbi:MAG: thioredoxin family protein [Planctomycetes bacterium]|nr:thioredoxin family protein [Planctomycetota bacterium]
MKKTLILAIIAVLSLGTFATANAGTVNEAGLDWFTDMDEAKEAAQKADKLIYIYFTGGVRCGWCVKMKKDTFSDGGVQKNILSKFVLVMLNTWENSDKQILQKDKALQAKYGGRGVPFNVVLDKNLELVTKFSGYKPADAFTETMKGVLVKYEEKLVAQVELEKLLKKTEKKSGRNYKNFYKICMLYYEKLDKLKEAAELAEKLVKNDAKNKNKNNAQLYLILGLQNMADKETEKATENFAEVKKLDKKNKEGFYEKVIQIEIEAFLNTKEWDKAIAVYEKFIKAKVKFFKTTEQDTKWRVAIAYLNKKDTDNAKKILQEVIDIDADTPIGKQAAKYLKQLGGSSGF